MLEEAVEVIRALWTGEVVNHRGTHYTVDTARIYTLPEVTTADLCVRLRAQGCQVAARIGDGFVSTSPDQELLSRFRKQAGADKVIQGGFKVGYAETADRGSLDAHRLWANSGLPGELAQVLPSPRHFEQASSS